MLRPEGEAMHIIKEIAQERIFTFDTYLISGPGMLYPDLLLSLKPLAKARVAQVVAERAGMVGKPNSLLWQREQI